MVSCLNQVRTHLMLYLTEENEKIYIEIIVKNQLEIYRKILDMPKENTYVLDLTKLDLNSSPKDIEVYFKLISVTNEDKIKKIECVEAVLKIVNFIKKDPR